MGADGRNPVNKFADKIWSALLDDFFDDDKIAFIQSIKKRIMQLTPEQIAE